MPQPPDLPGDDLPPEGERRSGLDRRVASLESYYRHIQAAMQVIEANAARVELAVDSRYRELRSAQDTILAKIEHVKDTMDSRLQEQQGMIAELRILAAQFRGAVAFARWTAGSGGVLAILGGLIALLKALAH